MYLRSNTPELNERVEMRDFITVLNEISSETVTDYFLTNMLVL